MAAGGGRIGLEFQDCLCCCTYRKEKRMELLISWVPLVLIWTALLSSNWLEEISSFWLSLFACKMDKVQPAHPWFVRQMTWNETIHPELFQALHRWWMPYAGVKAPILSFLGYIWITLQVAREGDPWQRHPSWESPGVVILLVQFYETILIFQKKNQRRNIVFNHNVWVWALVLLTLLAECLSPFRLLY